jgi:hypothetical protein
MEKLRDPSHVRALSLEELTGLCHDAGLGNLKTAFFKMEMELEALLAASFPGPGDADRMRQIFADDFDREPPRIGCNPQGWDHPLCVSGCRSRWAAEEEE